MLQPIINWNGFFGHQENVQVALLASSNVANRILAIEIILKIHKESDNRNPDESVRVFKVPKLNFLADHISELSVLEDGATEAPFTVNLSDGELKALAFSPLDLKGLPCTTQACERGVQVS